MSAESTPTAQAGLSSSLEDYLETIFELVRERGVARVRDIAEARKVKAASVSVALRRLASQGLIEYVEREHISLSPKGEVAARRVLARHHVLTDFLHQILGMAQDAASADACAMEHSLSDEGMHHLVRFLEYLRVCPEAEGFIQHFHRCGQFTPDSLSCALPCHLDHPADRPMPHQPTTTLADLPLLASARVQMIRGAGALRQRLLDLGLLPGASIQVLRAAPASGPLWVQLDGTQLSLRRQEAEIVLVQPCST
jgi:DtxR family Mn-dependent transcriptional regulator